MSNINRDYLIVLNPKTSKVTVPELNYYIYDKYTANLFVNLVTVENGKIVNMADADQYKLVLHVLKPTNEIQTVEDIQVFNKEKALFQIELDQELTKNIGRYKCELLTIDKTDHIVQSAKFSYRVKKSIYNDLDVVTETPQYPIIITLLDKLQDIDKYEEERRANEVARVAAEKARVKDYTDLRQTVTTDIDTMQEKIDSFDGKVQEVDNAVQQMRTNITNYQAEKNKELDSYKTQKDTQINTSIKNMENTIDTYKTEKDKQINDKITQQDTKIDKAIDLQNKNIQASTKALNDKLDAAVQDQNDTIAANNQAQNKVISDAVAAQNKTINTVVESDKVQNDRLDTLETSDTNNKAEIKKLQDKDVEHEERMTAIEAVNVEQNNRLDAIEIKNDQQDSRLNDVEAKNKKQDMDLKCLFAESHSERITLEDEVGNSVFLQNSKQGFATVDELKGNTLVNCNKDTDKELILNGNIDTSGYGTVTTIEGVDGGLVDVMCEGNTMVNVCDQEDPIAITKNYEVTTGNHIALQGEYDGKCRPVLNGNTLVNLWNKDKLELNGQCSLNGNKITCTTTDNQWSNFFMKDMSMFKPSTDYTLIVNITKNTLETNDNIYIVSFANNVNKDIFSAPGTPSFTINGGVTGLQIKKLTTLSSFEGATAAVRSFVSNNSKSAGRQLELDIVVLEGDYTNKPIPDYFTGLQSSFEDSYIPKTLVENNTQWTWSPSNKFKQILSASDTPITSSKITLVINCSSVSGYPLAVIRKVDGTDVTNLIDTKVGLNIATLENTGTITELKLFRDNNAQGYIIDNAFIVEGDYTNYDFTNYDSSKGGKYKVDYKVTGKNKFNKDSSIVNTVINIGNGSIITESKTEGQWYTSSVIDISNISNITISHKNDGYINSASGIRYLLMDENYNPKLYADCTYKNYAQTLDVSNYKYMKISILTAIFPLNTIQLEEGTTATTYEPYKEYTKTFYLNSPLLEGDTIEDVNGKATHVHRYGSITNKDLIPTFIDLENNNYRSDTSCACLFNFKDNTYNKPKTIMYCDKLPYYSNSWSGTNIDSAICGVNPEYDFSIRLPLSATGITAQDSVDECLEKFKIWNTNNLIHIVYQLATPTYETISNDSILCDSYVNGHLDVDSVIPIEKVEFKHTGFENKYLNSNTEYIIQFESDNIGKIDYIILGGAHKLDIDVTKGINKILCTSGESGNRLDIVGIGFNACNIVVTPKVEQTFGYFKGMKSVGECEDLEVVSSNNDNTLSNKQTMTHEPLRGLPNGVKDKYVIIDGKWYIERNCRAVQFKDLKYDRTDSYQKAEFPDVIGFRLMNTGINAPIMCDRFAYTNDRIINFGELLTNKENINITSGGSFNEFFITIQKAKLTTLDFNGVMKYFTDNPMEIIAKATTPTYEPIEYNPFEVYSATTHISNNSNIPCNMVIRNSGFNCMLKPNTTYTVSSNNGLSSVVTKDSIGDSVLRFYDKDTSSITKMNNVLVLEGDYITGNPPIPAFFKGMESTFEQELVTDEKDKNYGKYKVNVKAINPDNSQQNNITFYIKEPLRGVGDVKDKVYVKEDKVVVERNCGSVTFSDSVDEGDWYMQPIGHYQITSPYNIHLKQNLGAICNKLPVGDNTDQVYIFPILQGDISYIRVQNGVTKWKTLEQFKQYLQQNPITVIYQLATPTYEEVEYFDLKLFVEIFKDTTIIYNSNIPVTSTINYTYSTPLTDAVNTVSDISDQQDSMIIDMATQVATMEMMLM
jgi:hypothetical protein